MTTQMRSYRCFLGQFPQAKNLGVKSKVPEILEQERSDILMAAALPCLSPICQSYL